MFSTPSMTPRSFNHFIPFRVLLAIKLFHIIELLLETFSLQMTLPTCFMYFVIYQNNSYPKKFFLFDDDKHMATSFPVSFLF